MGRKKQPDSCFFPVLNYMVYHLQVTLIHWYFYGVYQYTVNQIETLL